MAEQQTVEQQEEEQTITPFNVSAKGAFNYDALISQWGVSPITDEMIAEIEELTGMPAHPWLKRGIFFAHRDLQKVLDFYRAGKPIYLYTGRGPSSEALHLGHLVPFMFTKYLQEAFGFILVVQMSDDEKFHFKDITLEEVRHLTDENSKDIIACGFDPEKTFIFSNMDYVGGEYYRNICRLEKKISVNEVNHIYGFNDSSKLGQVGWPAKQEAPALSTSFPHIFGANKDVLCFVPCAIDQEVYFRELRDHAEKLGFHKPALIETKFLIGLQGPHKKMDSTGESPSIFLTDTAKEIQTKINKYAFSGGGVTKEEQEEHGANLSVDVPYQWLTYFLMDDDELKDIGEKYSTGKMLTGQVKKRLIEVITELVENHKNERKKVTDEMLAHFMSVRQMDYHTKPKNNVTTENSSSASC